ncbi:28S ribosomal protein S31 [Apis cerana cerana]|uniref:Small ribosomal subunit protein mS31 n=1 Tax=Apis cerana cerana TaxID=94128 RepID=A0A2A3EDV2_APICC|nr:28S ribosomal protein S31 [Apis cerana cerana]
MITSHFFLKGIRTRIILPFQSNITLTVIRFNSSSSDSSSDSDSNSDSEDSNKDRENNKVFKTIEYLQSAKVEQKKRQIEKEITKAAQISTTTSTQDKEKIFLSLLNKIGDIQNADNTFIKSNIHKNTIEKKDKIYWEKENNIKNSIENMKYQSQNKFFNKKSYNKFKTKYDDDTTQSNRLINMLQTKRMIDINTKFETKIDNFKTNKSFISNIIKQKKLESTYKYKKTIKNIDESDADVMMFNINKSKNSDPNIKKIVPKFKMWDIWKEKELKFSIEKYPKNAFQEMIEWTKEGKLWKFPINNEQGMEDEYNVHFSKHVFLEHHLVPWCPSKGPIRHFMELVCVGLSKNPYMTIEEKYDHIMWYKNYFKDKQDLLQKLGIVE